jgi:hypothetical protein
MTVYFMAGDKGGITDEDFTMQCKSTKSTCCRGTKSTSCKSTNLASCKSTKLTFCNTIILQYIKIEIVFISFCS